MSQSDRVLTITAQPTAPTARCPRCGLSARRMHRDDTRRLRDLPLWEDAVRVGLRVRRCRCLNTSCTAHTFADRVLQVVRPAAQRPVHLPMALPQRGLALGGEAGARLGAELPLLTSPDTLRRLIRQLPAPPMATPAILGVDDGAMRRGRASGTLLVDLERHRPPDLVPDRPADTRAAWLRAYPGGTISSRERSTEDARGATLGAPAAQHVLARWHLGRHRREALARLLDRRPRRLAALPPVSQGATTPQLSSDARALRRSTMAQIARQVRRACRFARSQAGRALHAQGLSKRPMARPLHLRRTTAIRYLRPGECPERARSRRSSLLDPDAADVQTRWDEGCPNGAHLWRDIRTRGLPGTRRTVSTWVVLRRELERGRPAAYG